MASYTVFPRPEQPAADPLASSRPAPHSRFVEGSMNDRVSNAPPPTFLGPDELAAYERQFYRDSTSLASGRSRPTSGSDYSSHRNSGGSKFWEGLRDRFSMSRAQSSSSITTVSSNKSRNTNRFSQQSQATIRAPPNDKENAAISYPSREEVMENYKSLVDAGFFSSHAIQGTRHQPPRRPHTGVANDRPLPLSPPPPARDAPPVPFSEIVAQKQREIQQQHQVQSGPNPAAPALSSSLFGSIPYSATQPSPTGDPPLMKYPRPDPRPPISLPKKFRRPPPPQHSLSLGNPMPPPSSPSRGTKRAVAEMTGGLLERELASASTDNIVATAGGAGGQPDAGARKLVKKLRKSASRISADLSLHNLRPATSAGDSHNQQQHHPHSPYGATAAAVAGASTRSFHFRGGSSAATSSTSVNIVPPQRHPPLSSAGRAAMGVVRSISSSFKRDSTSSMPAAAMPTDTTSSSSDITMAEAPPQQPPSQLQQPIPPPPAAPRKLSKVRSLSRRVSLSGRSRPGSSSSSSFPPPPTAPPPPVPSLQPQTSHHQLPPSNITSLTDLAPPRTSATHLRPSFDSTGGGGDPMALDAPPTSPEPSPTRNRSMDMQPGGLSVPSFHYPQRQKRVPFLAAEDAHNAHRGLSAPVVDRGGGGDGNVGGQGRGHGHGHVKNGSFCFGTSPGQAIRDEAVSGGRDSALGGMGSEKENQLGDGAFAVY